MNANFYLHSGVPGPPVPRLLVIFFRSFFFFQSDRPTQHQGTHSTLNEKKRAWPYLKTKDALTNSGSIVGSVSRKSTANLQKCCNQSRSILGGAYLKPTVKLKGGISYIA